MRPRPRPAQNLRQYRPTLEALEDRLLLTTYTLANGALSAVSNGKSTVILTQVSAFAVDQSGDVFALRTDHTLNELKSSTNAWKVYGSDVKTFALDVDDNLIVAGMNSGAVWEATAGAADANGYGLWSTAGFAPTIAADGSLWFVGLGNADGHGNHPLWRFADKNLTQMPGAAIGLGAAEGQLWAFKNTGETWHWTGTSWVVWTSVQISTGSGAFVGTVKQDTYGNNAIYAWDNALNLSRMPGAAIALGNGLSGDLWSLDAKNQVWHWDGTAWSKRTSFAVADGSRFVLGWPLTTGSTDKAALRWSGGNLSQTMITGTTSYLYATSLSIAEGAAWALDSHAQLYRWDGARWALSSSVTAADGSTWFLGTTNADGHGNHSIFQLLNGKLTKMPGAALVLTSGGGTLFATSVQGGVQAWNGTAWVQKTVTRTPDGSLLVQIGKALWRTPAGQPVGQWHIFGSNVTSFAVNVAKDLVLTVVDGAVWQAPANAADPNGYGLWTTLGYVSVTAPDGSIWFVGTGDVDGHGNHPLFRLANGVLTAKPGGAISLGVAEGQIWSFSASSETKRWNGTAWVSQHGARFSGGAGAFLGIAELDAVGDHAIYAWDGSQKLYRLPGLAVALGNGLDDLWSLDAHNQVWRWDGAAWVKQSSVAAADGSRLFRAFPLSAANPTERAVLRWKDGLLTQTMIAGTTVNQYATGLAAAEGAVWASDANGQVFRWNGTTWATYLATVTDDGNAWFLGQTKVDDSGNHFVYRFSNGTLTRQPGSFVSFANGEGTIFAVNAQKQAWRWNGTAWAQRGAVTDAAGSIWFLGSANADGYGDRLILRFFNGRLGRMPDSAAALWMLEGRMWGLRAASNQAMYWNGSAWIFVPTTVARDGSLWFLGATNADGKGNHAIYRRSGNTITAMPGLARSLANSSTTGIWDLTAAGQVSHWNGAVWVVKATQAQNLGIDSEGGVYLIKTNGSVVVFKTTAWESVAAKALPAGNGDYWFLGDALDGQGGHAVYLYSGGHVSGAFSASGLGVAEGTAWVIDGSGQVFRWYLRGWNGPTSVTAADGSVWFLGDHADGQGNHAVYYFNGRRFYIAPVEAASLTGANGILTCTDATGNGVVIKAISSGFYGMRQGNIMSSFDGLERRVLSREIGVGAGGFMLDDGEAVTDYIQENAQNGLDYIKENLNEQAEQKEDEFVDKLRQQVTEFVFKEDSDRDEVRARLTKDGWFAVYGSVFDDAQYVELAAAIAASVATDNPEPLIAYFKDLIDRNIAVMSQEFQAVGKETLEKYFNQALMDAVQHKNGDSWEGSLQKIANTGIEIKLGIATYHNHVTVVQSGHANWLNHYQPFICYRFTEPGTDHVIQPDATVTFPEVVSGDQPINLTMFAVVVANKGIEAKTLSFRWGPDYSWETYTLAPGEAKALGMKPKAFSGKTVRPEILTYWTRKTDAGWATLEEDQILGLAPSISYTFSQNNDGRVLNAPAEATILNPFDLSFIANSVSDPNDPIVIAV